MDTINVEKLRNTYTKLEIAEMYKSAEVNLNSKRQEIIKLQKDIASIRELYHLADGNVNLLKKDIEALKVDRLADLKATKMYVEMADSGLTHREKGFISNNLVSIIDKRIEALSRSYDVHLVRDELPF